VAGIDRLPFLKKKGTSFFVTKIENFQLFRFIADAVLRKKNSMKKKMNICYSIFLFKKKKKELLTSKMSELTSRIVSHFSEGLCI
jgi:hypothetical protein